MTARRGRRTTACLLLIDGLALASLGPGPAGLAVFAGLTVLLQAALRLYDPDTSPRRDSRILAGALAFGLASLGTEFSGLGSPEPTRILLALTISQIGREALRHVLRSRAEPVVLKGRGPRTRALARALVCASCPRYRAVGTLGGGGRPLPGLPPLEAGTIGARLIDPADLELRVLRSERCYTGENFQLRPAEGPGDGTSRALKRAFDSALVLGSLPLTLPLFVLVLLANRLIQGAGPLHGQLRVTRLGRVFRIWKFRSMPIDAEPEGKPVWPAADDRRITRFGRLLRSSWLDELPQLWNVLRGDLSLVGPRPERPEFVQVFKVSLPRYTERHQGRAGITGLAQVRGFVGNTSLRKRLLSDLQYLESWSLWRDVAILGWTFCQAIRRKKRQRFDYAPGDEGPIP